MKKSFIGRTIVNKCIDILLRTKILSLHIIFSVRFLYKNIPESSEKYTLFGTRFPTAYMWLPRLLKLTTVNENNISAAKIILILFVIKMR